MSSEMAALDEQHQEEFAALKIRVALLEQLVRDLSEAPVCEWELYGTNPLGMASIEKQHAADECRSCVAKERAQALGLVAP